MILRIRFRQLGGHMHCRVFVGQRSDGTFQKAGEFILDAGAMWQDFVSLMTSRQSDGLIEIKHEDEP